MSNGTAMPVVGALPGAPSLPGTGNAQLGTAVTEGGLQGAALPAAAAPRPVCLRAPLLHDLDREHKKCKALKHTRVLNYLSLMT